MNGQRVGYVRIGTFEQNTERQLDNVARDRIFIDKVSGKDTKRPQLDALLSFVCAGDTAVMRALIRERQREGIALARQRGTYRGRKPARAGAHVADLRRRVEAGERKAQIARDYGISRETQYQYLRSTRCHAPATCADHRYRGGPVGHHAGGMGPVRLTRRNPPRTLAETAGQTRPRAIRSAALSCIGRTAIAGGDADHARHRARSGCCR